MSKAIDVSDLPAPLVNAIESLVTTYRESARLEIARQTKPPPIGWIKENWELPESFFEPLPEGVLDLFDGDGEIA